MMILLLLYGKLSTYFKVNFTIILDFERSDRTIYNNVQ